MVGRQILTASKAPSSCLARTCIAHEGGTEDLDEHEQDEHQESETDILWRAEGELYMRAGCGLCATVGDYGCLVARAIHIRDAVEWAVAAAEVEPLRSLSWMISLVDSLIVGHKAALGIGGQPAGVCAAEVASAPILHNSKHSESCKASRVGVPAFDPAGICLVGACACQGKPVLRHVHQQSICMTGADTSEPSLKIQNPESYKENMQKDWHLTLVPKHEQANYDRHSPGNQCQ